MARLVNRLITVYVQLLTLLDRAESAHTVAALVVKLLSGRFIWNYDPTLGKLPHSIEFAFTILHSV